MRRYSKLIPGVPPLKFWWVTPCTVTLIIFFTKPFDLEPYESTKDPTNCCSASLGGDVVVKLIN